MIRLKQLLIETGLAQKEFVRKVGLELNSVRVCLNHGWLPKNKKKRAKFMGAIEAWILSDSFALAWLEKKDFSPADIWLEWPDGKSFIPKKHGIRGPAMVPGDPLTLEPRKDTEMITGRAIKHFKLFRDPFINDINKDRDIFLSEEHRFLREMMLDAARYKGFVAVVGGVGSGKSVIRKSVAEKLMSDGIKVVFPLIVDKARTTPAGLIDAIIMDISDETPKQALEQKTRQAVRLLKARAEGGMKQVMMIEEAHALDKLSLKALKQIHEFEMGFEKLIGIILIGQPELLDKLDIIGNADIREVIQRITTAEIHGLGDDVKPYLDLKFNRIGKKVSEIFKDDVYDALNKRLERVRGSKVVNRAYPLAVNNLVARAINTAAQMGEARVTADMIMSC